MVQNKSRCRTIQHLICSVLQLTLAFYTESSTFKPYQDQSLDSSNGDLEKVICNFHNRKQRHNKFIPQQAKPNSNQLNSASHCLNKMLSLVVECVQTQYLVIKLQQTLYDINRTELSSQLLLGAMALAFYTIGLRFKLQYLEICIILPYFVFLFFQYK